MFRISGTTNGLLTKTGFQSETLESRCDWLTLALSFPHWLRAPSSHNQFVNLPKFEYVESIFISLIIKYYFLDVIIVQKSILSREFSHHFHIKFKF